MRRAFHPLLILCLALSFHAQADEKKAYSIAWSHYTGWEPWDYADQSGILKKWADRAGIAIQLVRIDGYVASISQYSAGKFQGCAMTNMDALTMPAVGGVDSTALIIGDFSNGNDGIVLKDGRSMAELKGRKVRLVPLSVSHYLLSRALQLNGMAEQDVTVVGTSDGTLGKEFLADKDPRAAAVTWNPILAELSRGHGAALVFDSSRIPGEIIDLMVVRADSPPALKRALVGAWYEALALMDGAHGTAVKAAMAASAGMPVEEFEAQLKTTALFYRPALSVAFVEGPLLKKTMEQVRSFSYAKGLYGKGASSKDSVGIQFPDGSVLGSRLNVKLRFDSNYAKKAMKGTLW